MRDTLATIESATRMLGECRTAGHAKRIADFAEAMGVYARKMKLGEEAERYAGEIRLRAMKLGGDLLRKTERAHAGRKAKESVPQGNQLPTLRETGLTKKESSMMQKISKYAEEEGVEFEEAAGRGAKPAEVVRKARKKKVQETIDTIKRRETLEPAGKFSTLVVDPPWQMEKIERECRPNQVGFDYPTMTQDEIEGFDIDKYCEKECHLYLWTTQKHLWDALNAMVLWKFKYMFMMVWKKSGGFQPVGLPQFNCEFVLFGKRGVLPFMDTKGFSTCFEGKRREHSRKPEEFYELVKRVSPAPRLDIFSRGNHDGFSAWGNETGKFDG